jgi:hypothetical protein
MRKFYISSEPADQTKAIDTLAAYGEQAVDAITEVINLFDISDQVRPIVLMIPSFHSKELEVREQ